MDLATISDTQIGAALLGLALAGLVCLQLIRSSRRPRTAASYGPYHGVSNAALQLEAVMAGSFRKKRLMNATEYRVFVVVERTLAELKQGHRLFAQTSLGEVLESADAHHTINAKRIDILIVDRGGWPVLAIECQGAGHFQGNAAVRDAIKKEALRRAGVRYIEFTPDDGDSQIRTHVRESLGIGDVATSTSRPPLAAAR